MFVGEQNLEIAAGSAACIFNEGYQAILLTMETMGVQIGPAAQQHAHLVDQRRTETANRRSSAASKDNRTALRTARLVENEYYEEV